MVLEGRHLDSFDVATAAKNTVLHDAKLTSTAVEITFVSSFGSRVPGAEAAVE